MRHLKKLIGDEPKRDGFFKGLKFDLFVDRIVKYVQDLHEQILECMNVINSSNNGTQGKDGKDGIDGTGVQNIVLNPNNSFTFFLTDGNTITTDELNIEGGEDGVGIKNIQVIETSQESSGLNKIRITLTNNSYFDFNIYNGAKGTDGTNGVDGKDGIDGKDGKDGVDGVDGQPGANGSDGVGISSIVVNENSSDGGNNVVTINLTNNTQKTFNIKNGSKGSDGNPGTDGTNGSDGITPHIDSTTGNWFIGNTNTGVHAQGPSGIDGTLTVAAAQSSTFTASVGNYYKVTFSSAITIQLDTPDDTTKLSSCIFLITGSSGSVIFSAETGVDVYQSKGFTIDTGKIYEVNALFNGTAWYLTQVEMEVQS